MTLATDLKNLKPGDVLVLRDGTLRSFEYYNDGWIVACGVERPFVWKGSGMREIRIEEFWDIVRVIKAKKAKPEKDAAYLLRLFSQPAVVPRNSGAYGVRLRIRKIAKRLEAMK